MPGGIMTPLQRHLPREEMMAFGWIDEEGNVGEGFKTPEQGASTSRLGRGRRRSWKASAGSIWRTARRPSPFDKANPRVGVMPHALDPEAADRLWALSVETTGRERSHRSFPRKREPRPIGNRAPADPGPRPRG